MINQLREYYSGKTILVTGHTGFKGSWLSWWLVKFDAKVVGYSLDPVDENGIFNISRLTNYITDIRGDIRNYPFLVEKFKELEPDVVFHLAAQPLVLEAYSNPFETYEINVMGTLNILRAIEELDKQIELIIVTSDKVYRNDEKNSSFVETDCIGGYDPYSSSKACADILAESWRYSFLSLDNYSKHKKAISTVRAGNVIGGGDLSPNRLVPDILRSNFSNKKLYLRFPNSTRPWQHVLEPVYGYLVLAFNMNKNPHLYSGAWNFGPSNEQVLSVQELVDKFRRVYSNLDVKYGKTNFKESTKLSIDSTKAFSLLRWRPILDIDSVVDYVIQWEASRSKGNNMKDLILSQIDDFIKKINNV
jgi:CDP-glucose 4,6-dehydratase